MIVSRSFIVFQNQLIQKPVASDPSRLETELVLSCEVQPRQPPKRTIIYTVRAIQQDFCIIVTVIADANAVRETHHATHVVPSAHQ